MNIITKFFALILILIISNGLYASDDLQERQYYKSISLQGTTGPYSYHPQDFHYPLEPIGPQGPTGPYYFSDSPDLKGLTGPYFFQEPPYLLNLTASQSLISKQAGPYYLTCPPHLSGSTGPQGPTGPYYYGESIYDYIKYYDHQEKSIKFSNSAKTKIISSIELREYNKLDFSGFNFSDLNAEQLENLVNMNFMCIRHIDISKANLNTSNKSNFLEDLFKNNQTLYSLTNITAIDTVLTGDASLYHVLDKLKDNITFNQPVVRIGAQISDRYGCYVASINTKISTNRSKLLNRNEQRNIEKPIRPINILYLNKNSAPSTAYLQLTLSY